MIAGVEAAVAILQAKYPDRDVCKRCFMTFVRNKASVTAEGPMRCPQCSRRFWYGESKSVGTCYTAGHTEAA